MNDTHLEEPFTQNNNSIIIYYLPTLMESRVKFCNPQTILEFPNRAAASRTTDVGNKHEIPPYSSSKCTEAQRSQIDFKRRYSYPRDATSDKVLANAFSLAATVKILS